MASMKERQRWEQIVRRNQEMNLRQRDAINRLLLMNTEAMAALYEIAHMGDDKESALLPLSLAKDRAMAAIETVERLRTSQAAADNDAEEDSNDERDDVPSEETNDDGS